MVIQPKTSIPNLWIPDLIWKVLPDTLWHGPSSELILYPHPGPLWDQGATVLNRQLTGCAYEDVKWPLTCNNDFPLRKRETWNAKPGCSGLGTGCFCDSLVPSSRWGRSWARCLFGWWNSRDFCRTDCSPSRRDCWECRVQHLEQHLPGQVSLCWAEGLEHWNETKGNCRVWHVSQ